MSDRWVMGLDLGGTALKYGLLSSTKGLAALHTRPSGAARGRAGVLDQVNAALRHLHAEARAMGAQVEAVGLACPGTVDQGTMTGALPNLPHMAGVRIVEELEAVAGLPAVADNDANLMTLAEAKVGAARGADPVVGITLGTGLGAGIVLAGEVFRGAGAAGELGHVRLVPDGRRCPCGGVGCAEQYASVPALCRAYRDAGGTDASPEEIVGRWRSGDPVATAALHEWASWVGRTVAVAMQVVHPRCVVVGGAIVEAGEPLIELIASQAKAHTLDYIGARTVVRRASLGAAAGVWGAGILALGLLGVGGHGPTVL